LRSLVKTSPVRARLALLLLSASTGCAIADREPGSARPALGHQLAAPAESRGSAWQWQGAWGGWNALRGDPYELDQLDRFRDDGSKVECDREGLVNYGGSAVRYHGPVLVNEAFRARLQRFEEVVIATATEVYGRAPSRVRHMGAFSCRPSRNRSYRLSEHALGNAIDISGFDFAPVPKGQSLDPALPKQLKSAFQVRVARHWDRSDSPANEVHARFLRKLTDNLLERNDVFRGMIGPADPSHADHFHFDVAPWRYVRL
jgi:hypothetical protein